MNWWRRLRSGFPALFQKKLDTETDDEMSFCLAMQARENVEAGMNWKVARYATIRSSAWMGQISEVRRKLRSVNWIEALWSDGCHHLCMRIVLTLVMVTLVTCSGSAMSSNFPRSAQELLCRVSERSRKVREAPPQYEFTRTKTTLEFNRKGKVETREEQTYRMVMLGGSHYARLVAKDGRPLSGEELANQQEEESTVQQNERHGNDGDSVLRELEGDFFKRFEFEAVGLETIDGRACDVVRVRPRKDLPAKESLHKVMARIAGQMWIDENESEVVKLELGLTKPIHIGLGVLGAVQQVQFYVRRTRLPDGAWADSTVRVWLQFRVLLDTKRIKYEETTSDFTPVTTKQP